MIVKKRQFRLEHPDPHYCAIIFRYMQEYAVKYRTLSIFVSLDVKHQIKLESQVDQMLLWNVEGECWLVQMKHLK